MNFDEKYWNDRYKLNDTRWDIGFISPPLKEYFDQLTNKNLKILIPGGGNSYEAEYLHQLEFTNVYVADVSEIALKNITTRVSDFPKHHLLHSNFFDLQEEFDLIIEQTFFCAINPSLRNNYVLKASQLLKTKGEIVGLLFLIPLNEDHPPFGGNKEEYHVLFNSFFHIKIMEPAFNSIPKRMGNELFIKLMKK
ncbi:MAG: hypothetical protein ACJAX7_000457 [Saprospiraceae bacterium]|jgi:hypothetical protein|uniref:SAM-dependent methyltransferase n=1 Tax=Candidatus Marifrigoribacter sp. Uisw_064 TaxID=3230970 RepID=UPI003AE68C27